MKNVWEASNLEKRNRILKQLIEGGKCFNELCELVGMGRQTLNIYLKYLVKEKCIKRVRQGKFVFYSLEINHPDVLSLLERYRILGEIDFSRFDAASARYFLARWLNSVESTFLNVVEYYIYVGMRELPELKNIVEGSHNRPLEELIQEEIFDMNEFCRLYGELLSKKIQIRDIKPEMILIARNQLLERLERDLISESERT